MSYCTLEEAWGSDFKKHKKKSKRDQRLEKEEQKMLHESIDPQILVPDTHRDNSPALTQDIPNSHLQGYDNSFDSYISPYQKYASNDVEQRNQTVLETETVKPSVISKVEFGNRPVENNDNIVHLTQDGYNQLKYGAQEGFTNQTDEQFNQLILYIFTGIFYLLMLDMMYQLGKKSY
jgi:hypothetical protein